MVEKQSTRTVVGVACIVNPLVRVAHVINHLVEVVLNKNPIIQIDCIIDRYRKKLVQAHKTKMELGGNM